MNDISITLFAFPTTEDLLKGGTVALAIRIAFSVFGALLGWFLSGPIWCLLHRIVARKAIGGMLLALLRLLSAAGAAVAIFLFLPIGFGSGFGFGPGPGGVPGGGPGTGQQGATPGENLKDANKDPNKSKSLKQSNETIDIEVAGGDRVTQPGKYYLIERKGDPVSLQEVAAFLEPKKGKVNVRMVLTNVSVFGPPREMLKSKLSEMFKTYDTR